MSSITSAFAALSLLVWAYLLLLHGRFWSAGPVLLPTGQSGNLPDLDVVVPARNEAEGIEAALRSLLAQEYPGDVNITLVDDESVDGTGDIARAIGDNRLTVIAGTPRPNGWSGKLWAVAQGVANGQSDLVLLTDADIVHDPAHLATLAAKIETGLDMVSEMVELRCTSMAERTLVPAFVFFFQMLYPFYWVNDPCSNVAAAAGGTILVRRTALERVGGIGSLRNELIDDVALATRLKPHGPIFLGHSALACSLRPYSGPTDIWRMVARTAYVQLHFSPLILLGTILGLALVWVLPPLVTLFASGPARWMAAIAWLMSALSYVPTLRRFERSALWAVALPGIASFYMAATVGSAVNHHWGCGVRWKDRAYRGVGA